MHVLKFRLRSFPLTDMEEAHGQENVASVTLNDRQDSVSLEAQLVQQERDRKRQTLQLYEARRRQTIEERRRRLALYPEPRDGVCIQVKYGDGSARRRRFYVTQSIQILFDFAGLDDMATDVFHIQTASSSTTTPSTSTGTLSEHGITTPSTVYVLWLGPGEVEERLTLNALVAVPTSVLPSHSTAIHLLESTAATELNTAPSGSQDNLSHKHKELARPPGGTVAEAVEDSIVALSWPWFIPIEDTAVERPSLSPSHSTMPSVTSLPNPHPCAKRRRMQYSWLLERERAELQRERAELQRERAELELERAELQRERAELEMDRAELALEREQEEAELKRERAELQRDRAHVERSRRALFLFHTLLRKL
ncbi:PH domain-containing protein DDB_G0287875-like isoform X2 [Anguilla anguilla]|uniref:PH domain-containing protein DDB_G0287875-like isoform X2 n=1 Tax=Anguilla anguilla TaxID=7936 RepID=UPI0015AD5105|nr:PH domain-containing protein DDB_G0287875-like isoform X2 [Anguilla anguilla]